MEETSENTKISSGFEFTKMCFVIFHRLGIRFKLKVSEANIVCGIGDWRLTVQKFRTLTKKTKRSYLTISSPSGFPKNPPTSAPTNAIPATENERHIGTDASRCPHSAVLSPVQIAAYLRIKYLT